MGVLYIKNGGNWDAVAPGGGIVPAGGTTGQVLSKINATDYNTAWVAQSVDNVIPATARWLTVSGADATTTLNIGWSYHLAVCCPPCTIDGLGCEVTTQAGAGGVIRLGIYANHASRLEPSTRLIDGGTVSSTTTGWKSLAITPTVHAGGWMWLTLAAQTAGCTIRACSGHGEPWVMFGTGPQVPPGLTYRSWTSASFNGAFPATITDIGVAPQLDPKIAFKTSA